MSNITCICQNCGRIWSEDELHDIDDLNQRVLPGETVPYGQCPVPDCGALCRAATPEEIGNAISDGTI